MTTLFRSVTGGWMTIIFQIILNASLLTLSWYNIPLENAAKSTPFRVKCWTMLWDTHDCTTKAPLKRLACCSQVQACFPAQNRNTVLAHVSVSFIANAMNVHFLRLAMIWQYIQAESGSRVTYTRKVLNISPAMSLADIHFPIFNVTRWNVIIGVH